MIKATYRGKSLFGVYTARELESMMATGSWSRSWRLTSQTTNKKPRELNRKSLSLLKPQSPPSGDSLPPSRPQIILPKLPPSRDQAFTCPRLECDISSKPPQPLTRMLLLKYLIYSCALLCSIKI